MCATGSERPQPFFSAGDTSLSQEVADGKISVQSACALNTVHYKLPYIGMIAKTGIRAEIPLQS
jgi:hypothetical protein